MGFPSTIMFFKVDVYLRPWEMQKMDFYSMKLNDKSKNSSDFVDVNNSAILVIGGYLSSYATPKRLLLRWTYLIL